MSEWIGHFLAGRDWFWSDDWSFMGLSGLVLGGWWLRGFFDRHKARSVDKQTPDESERRDH